jgi:ATP-binding cassette subfamily C protein
MRDTILDVRIAAFDKIINSSYKQFSQKSKDIYISNLVNDINNFEKNFFLNLLNVIYRAGIYTVSLIIIFLLEPYLGAAVFLVSFIMFFLVRAFEKKTVSLQKQLSEDNEQFTVNMSNTFNGLEILKINNIEDRFISKNIDEIDKVEHRKFHFRFFTESQRNVTNIMGYITFIGILIYLMTQVEANGLKYGMVMLLIQLANNVTFTLPDIFPRLNVIRASKDIYEKITSLEEENDDLQRTCGFHFEDSMEVKSLTFSYDDKEIFKDASCTIKKGKKYLIKGVSGIGKSTLVKILSLTYENYEGDITIDGLDLKNIREKDFNDKVAFIYQDVFLFEDTIKNNISLYKPLNPDDLTDAITKAGLDDFISTKEKGVDEMVAENGKNLSGGERQRISIARAIAKKAEVPSSMNRISAFLAMARAMEIR